MSISGLLGTKIEQSQAFDEKGQRIPVTKVNLGPCVVVHISKTNPKKIQLGFGIMKKTNKPSQGHIKGAGIKTAPRFLKVFETEAENEYVLGAEIKAADVFKVGDKLKITGTSKGKGFAGVMKRHNFKGGPKTHGQSNRYRSPGSIGSTTTPGRVYKGKRMAGRMGGEQVTIKGLKVVNIDMENNQLLVSGLIPGARGNLISVYKV